MSLRTFLSLFRAGNKKTVQRRHAFLAAINIELIYTTINDPLKESEFGLTEKGIVAECGTGADRFDVHSSGELPRCAHQVSNGVQWSQVYNPY